MAKAHISAQSDNTDATIRLHDRIGEKLLKSNFITPDQLQIALHEQRRTEKMLGAVLVQLGFLDGESLASVLAERTGYLNIDLKKTLIDPALMAMLPKHVAERCRAVPISLNDNRLEMAMADPYDVVAMDELSRYFPRHYDLTPCVASSSDIAEIIEHYSGFTTSLDSILTELETGDSGTTLSENWQHPVIRLVNTILFDAVKRGASDIHLEPAPHFIRLRYRIDGVLQQVRALHRAHWPELSHRLKIMAGMNIADTRSLQDGRFALQVGGADIDFRMAVMPTAQGENIVIRILDHRNALLPLEKLGFHADALPELQRILERPEGIVLVTGPTGSGKTTTLYSILSKISTTEVNIMTLEDPIEYQFDLIRQTAVQEQQGLGFAEGVRGILRQDPNIIFIGEVRDSDTAQMALRAAMTGHQIFSTLHCNDALGALPRLIDLGLHPRMLAGNITGVIAQRLVRKLCPHCKITRHPTEDECRILNCGETSKIAEPKGCAHCHNIGYRGRIAISEILRVTQELDELIATDAPRSVMQKLVATTNFRSMMQDGIAKVIDHTISLSELRRGVDMTRFS
jgi:type II secretory ATPase GspE/PulE/Tfp pilus assembly ATPase PilB-like protein